MPYPSVTVTDISDILLAGCPLPPTVDLGDAGTSQKVNAILSKMRASATHAYILQWNGSKIPRGTIIDGHEIGWTQNGVVTGVNGEDMGSYDRLVEFGGETRDNQVMVVYTR